ncbi:MAG: chromate transporter, partial [Candidatus Binatia bacterium]
TPGPVFTTATFIGYLLAGVPGALVATAGIFLPSFAFVAATRPLVSRLRRSRLSGAFLDGVNVASLSLMVVVTLQLAADALDGLVTMAIGAGAMLLLWTTRLNPAWLILAGAAVGVGARLLG